MIFPTDEHGVANAEKRSNQKSIRLAKEKRSCHDVITTLPAKTKMVQTLLRRLSLLTPVPEKPFVLDVGAAQGETVIALREIGCSSFGPEPFGVIALT